MTEQEAKFILFKASAAYPNQMELEDETIMVWIERLTNVPFASALENLNHHIDNEEFFPKISQVIGNRVSTGDQLQLTETEQRLALEDNWLERAVDPPAHIMERWGRK